MSDKTKETEEALVTLIKNYGGHVYRDIKYISFTYEPSEEAKEVISLLIDKYNYEINRNVGSL